MSTKRNDRPRPLYKSIGHTEDGQGEIYLDVSESVRRTIAQYIEEVGK